MIGFRWKKCVDVKAQDTFFVLYKKEGHNNISATYDNG